VKSAYEQKWRELDPEKTVRCWVTSFSEGTHANRESVLKYGSATGVRSILVVPRGNKRDAAYSYGPGYEELRFKIGTDTMGSVPTNSILSSSLLTLQELEAFRVRFALRKARMVNLPFDGDAQQHIYLVGTRIDVLRTSAAILEFCRLGGEDVRQVCQGESECQPGQNGKGI